MAHKARMDAHPSVRKALADEARMVAIHEALAHSQSVRCEAALSKWRKELSYPESRLHSDASRLARVHVIAIQTSDFQRD
jgi:hypothetical protein